MLSTLKGRVELTPIPTKVEDKLTLKAPIMTAADGIHKYFFIVFEKK